MDVSVVITTYNGATSIGQTLKSLEEMSVPENIRWEVIVVDNNSNDGTKKIVDEFLQKNNFPLKYIFEEKRGKPFALNAALKATKGKIVAFTDDDCIVSPNWITSITTEFSSDSSLSGIGGRVELYNREDCSVSIRTYKERIPFSSPDQLYGLIMGCNMAFARKVFEEIGEFDPLVGPGAKIGSGDDIDIIYRAYRKKFKILYVPNILIYHNHGRKTEEQVRSLNRRYMIGRGAFYCKYVMKGEKYILRMAYREVSSLLKEFLKRLLLGESVKDSHSALSALAVGAIRRLTMVQP